MASPFKVVFVSQAEQFDGSGYESFDFTPSADDSENRTIVWVDLGLGEWVDLPALADDEQDAPPIGNPEVSPVQTGDKLPAPEVGATPVADAALNTEAITSGTQILTGGDDIFHYQGGLVSIDAGEGTDTILLDGPASNYLIYHFQKSLLSDLVPEEIVLAIFDVTTGDRIIGQGVEKIAFTSGAIIDLPDADHIAGYAGSPQQADEATAQLKYADSSADGIIVTYEQHGKAVTQYIQFIDWGTGLVSDHAGQATVLGTNHADVIYATQSGDTVSAGGGDDVIRAAIAPAEDASANLFGGAGDDKFFLDDARGVAFGGQGDDTIYAGSGAFVVSGDQGFDTLVLNEKAEDLLLIPAGAGQMSLSYIGLSTKDGKSLGGMQAIEAIQMKGGDVWHLPDSFRADGASYYSLVRSHGELQLKFVATAFEVAQDPTLIGLPAHDDGARYPLT